MLDPEKAYIWSSSTLYDDETRDLKQKLFNKFISENNNISPLQFHLIGKENEAEPTVFIKREKVETVSTTVVDVKAKSIKMAYTDHLKNSNIEVTLAKD